MSQVEELESNIDIVELVKRYTNLKKAGVNYKALCPFPGHSEKTPSFVVSPSKQIAHCFWCRRGWGPLKFIMDVENCEFRDALEILSSMTGIKLKGFDAQKENHKKNIYSLGKDIVQYYKQALSNHPHIWKYVSERGVSQESIEKFFLGYSDSGIELYSYLKNKWYDDELIEESNVFHNLASKRDKFIGRIIFPIQNNRWDIVWFAGRIVDIWEPKYLNSPASAVYDKSSILYGLYQARNEIAKKDFIIITEWYLDTISLHQAGFSNTVCVSGVALSEKHISIIKKLTSKIYLCFDNDSAWENATKYAIELLKNKDIEVKIISLSWGKDPDEILKSGGDFEVLIQNALSPIGYLLSKMNLSKSIQDTKSLLSTLLWVVKNYKDGVERDFYLKEIAGKLDIKLEVVYEEYSKLKIGSTPTTTKFQTKHTSEELLIGYLIKYPEKKDFIQTHIQMSDFLDQDLKKILTQWLQVIDEMDLEKKNRYLGFSQNDEAIEIQAQLENHSSKNEEKIESILLKTIEQVNKNTLKVHEAYLKKQIQAWDMWAIQAYQELLKMKK